MQTLKLNIEDSFNAINAKLAEIDFTKEYKVEIDDYPITFTKVADNLYHLTRWSPYGDVWNREWKFSSEYTSDKEILLDLFESWRTECRFEYMR